MSFRIGISMHGSGMGATMNSGIRLEAGLSARLVLFGAGGVKLAEASFPLEPAAGGPRSPNSGILYFTVSLPEGEPVRTTILHPGGALPEEEIRGVALYLSNDGVHWEAYATSDEGELKHALTRLNDDNRRIRMFFATKNPGLFKGLMKNHGYRPAEDGFELSIQPITRPGTRSLVGFEPRVDLTAQGWTGSRAWIPRPPPVRRATWQPPIARDLSSQIESA